MPTHISYPPLFSKKLSRNLEIRSAVDATLVDFDSWFQDSKLPFFPDYTDHGVIHVSEVLETAANLIRPSAQALFSAEDAAILILAALLHDAALHLSEAAFRELIIGDSSKKQGQRDRLRDLA